jgi:hypothetical protein
MTQQEIPNGFKEIEIQEDITEWDLKGCFLFNKTHKIGGFFNYGNDKGFSIGDIWESSQTGDTLYDHITINGYKVYKL